MLHASTIANLLGAGLALTAMIPYAALAEDEGPPETTEISGTSIKRAENQTGTPLTVEITGSRLKRLESETGLPVTVIRAEDLRRQGVATAEDAVQRISANQSVVTSNGVVGSGQAGHSEANLRGLGGNKTLVLLNGRRIANHPYTSGTTDLNAIPFAAVERIEVLRDGASAIYGTDAIGGVINFITRKDFHGAEVSGEYQGPEHAGGDAHRFSLTGGVGTLATDRYNILGTIDYRKQDPLRATDRDFAASGVNLEHGVIKSSGLTFPSNIFQASTHVSGNPYFPACRPPDSFSLVNVYGPVCRTDYARTADLIPENKRTNLLGRATFALNDTHTAVVEYTRAQNEVTTQSAPTTISGLSMSPASPYFPGNGITPAVTGLNPAQNISLSWRVTQIGPRITQSDTVSERLGGQLEGKLGSWDYRTGLFRSRTGVIDSFVSGFVGFTPVSQAVRNGNPLFLNPFNDASAVEAAFLDSSQIVGHFIDARGDLLGIDAYASREIGHTSAGPISLAIGAEKRNEKYRQTFNYRLSNDAFGIPAGVDMSVAGSRGESALFGEMAVPITKTLEAQFALRHDRYSDIGNTTNPKLSLRYQPMKSFLLRASANTGFRAPTLYEINQPARISPSAGSFNDPLLCPNGVVAPNGNAARDCRQQLNTRSAGNQDLKPEQSRTYTFGTVFEPTPSLSASLDYWNVVLKDRIGVLTPQAIFGDLSRYGSKFVRCGQLSAAAASAITACRTQSGTIDPVVLAYVDTANENLGNVKTDGLDLSLNYRLPQTPLGRITLGYEGTYVHRYQFQREKNGAYVDNTGRLVDTLPIFRWQHRLSAAWNQKNWSAVLVNNFKSGYEDQNDPAALINPSFRNHVGRYSLWDASLTWSGTSHLRVTGGVQNIFNKAPPFSNQNFMAQANYDPRVTDARGRTFLLRATYAF